MFHLLLLAFLLVGVNADPELDATVEESAPPIQVYNLNEVHQGQNYENGNLNGYRRNQEPHNVYLQDIQGYKGQSNIDRIVSELYNPDYFEPVRVLDYRYLKTGGRDYSRDAGGQVLILPYNVRLNQKKEFANYDELLEFLRLQQLAEQEAQKMEMSNLGYENMNNGNYLQRIEIRGNQQQNLHNNNHLRGYGGSGLYGGYGRSGGYGGNVDYGRYGGYGGNDYGRYGGYGINGSYGRNVGYGRNIGYGRNGGYGMNGFNGRNGGYGMNGVNGRNGGYGMNGVNGRNGGYGVNGIYGRNGGYGMNGVNGRNVGNLVNGGYGGIGNGMNRGNGPYGIYNRYAGMQKRGAEVPSIEQPAHSTQAETAKKNTQ